jgi:penicillin-binding protein 2
MLAVFSVFGFRAADFQIVTADKFASENANLTAVSTEITATRGLIVDRYGRPIAVNRDGYNVVFNSAYMKKADYNSTILKMCELLEMYETSWNDVLPMTKESPYAFTDDTTAVKQLLIKLGLNDYASAQNCYDEMVERYSLKGYNEVQRRIIMGVRYSMERADFSVSYPFTFAEDISSELMLVISESYSGLAGVEVEIKTYREYTDPSLAVHTIGTIGKINANEWTTLKDQGYSYSDYVGKNGVEKAFENYLRGEDGKLTYYFDKSGNVVKTEVTKEPTQGNTVFLTIDSKLQKVAQDALAKNIKKLNASGSSITGGAVVITAVKTGEVLASANYPSYSLDTYYSDYSSIATAPNTPLYDRAFRGVYPPGSAFKPMVAIAGLQEGIITTDTEIYCSQRYTYYKDYQPKCMHYHRNVNVYNAISRSCNYFFFDVGRQVGISRLNEYSLKLGLGQLTGVEIAESAGILAGPNYSLTMGTTWYDGLTLQASIGQSDNAFTPLQLSSYTGTIANGGTRYKTTLLNSVKSVATNSYVYKNTPTVLNTLDVKDEVITAVKLGMKSVAQEGTASAYFADYPVSIGGKTGTAQTSGLDNNVLILFAPYEDPEIAISIVVEHGEKSYTTGPVAKAILDEYFFGSHEDYTEVLPDNLIK